MESGLRGLMMPYWCTCAVGTSSNRQHRFAGALMNVCELGKVAPLGAPIDQVVGEQYGKWLVGRDEFGGTQHGMT